MTLITIIGVVWMLTVVGMLLLLAWGLTPTQARESHVQRLRRRRSRDRHRFRLLHRQVVASSRSIAQPLTPSIALVARSQKRIPHMNVERSPQQARNWINPKYPGLNKSIPLGFVCGFLGPIGVGLYLRSFLDFGLSMILSAILIACAGDGPGMEFIPCIACSMWVVGRIAWDAKRKREEDEGEGGAPQMAPIPQPSAPDQPSGRVAVRTPRTPPPDDMRLIEDEPEECWVTKPALVGMV